MTGERARQIVRRVMSSLRQEYGPHGVSAKRPGLEELLLGVLAADSTERKATAALRACTDSFVDWNEMRVSADGDILAALEGVPDAERKAAVLRAVLQRVYEVNNEMSLDFLKDRGPRDGVKLVAGIHGFPEEALARVMLLSLGHDELPVTPGLVRMAKRLAIINEGSDGKLDKAAPSSNLFEFHWLFSRHAATVCRDGEPLCETCCIRKECKAGAAKPGRSKSTASAPRAAAKKGKSSSR